MLIIAGDVRLSVSIKVYLFIIYLFINTLAELVYQSYPGGAARKHLRIALRTTRRFTL